MSEQSNMSQNSSQLATQICPACHRDFQVPTSWQAISCPLCQQAALQNQNENRPIPETELIVPVGLDANALQSQMSAFCKGTPFPLDDFTPENLTQRLILVYWPIWLTDADLKGEWDAIFGFDYQVESTRESMGSGRWASQKVIKTRVKEEPRKGYIERHYDNLLSPAIPVHDQRLTQLGDYDMSVAQVFDPNRPINGAIQNVALWPRDLEENAKRAFSKLAVNDCRHASGAQHPSAFTFNGTFANMRWTQGLLPMYASFYEDDKGARHVVALNGQSGKVYGRRIASTKKAARLTWILIAISLLLILALYLLKIEQFLCASPALILSLIPTIRARNWNAKERAKPPLA